MTKFTQADLEAYLDEALLPAEMAAMETELRGRPDLLQQLAAINARRDAGVHSVGEIWRRHRLSCPTREHLGGFVLDTLDSETRAYIAFHIEKIGCRYCQANYEDLCRAQKESDETVAQRRSRYFQSSAGHLKRGKK